MRKISPTAVFYRKVAARLRERRALEIASLPRVDLEVEHMRNVTMLPSREHLLDQLPRHSVVAELGVDQGAFSRKILDRAHPRKLHLVDAWGDETRYHDGLKQLVHQTFDAEIRAGVVEVNIGRSVQVLPTFPDDYFDWIYIDTDHSYDTTRAELSIARAKVKRGGMITGHDFTMGNWSDGIKYGVIEAVREFCVDHHWEIIYLTAEAHGYHSFALRQICERRDDSALRRRSGEGGGDDQVVSAPRLVAEDVEAREVPARR